MEVQKTSQVLSHTVAVGIYTHVQFRQVEHQAIERAAFVDWMGLLFDALNLSKQQGKISKYFIFLCEDFIFFSRCSIA